MTLLTCPNCGEAQYELRRGRIETSATVLCIDCGARIASIPRTNFLN